MPVLLAGLLPGVLFLAVCVGLVEIKNRVTNFIGVCSKLLQQTTPSD